MLVISILFYQSGQEYALFHMLLPPLSLPLTDVFNIATSLLFDLPGVLHSSRVCNNDRGSPANGTAASWAALTKPGCFKGSQRKVMLHHQTERRDSDQLPPLIIPKDRSSYSVEAACHESLTSSGDMQTKQLGSIVRGVGHVYSVLLEAHSDRPRSFFLRRLGFDPVFVSRGRGCVHCLNGRSTLCC